MWILKLIHIVFDKLISHHFKKLLTWVEIDKNIHQNIHDLNRGFSDIMLDNLSNISFDRINKIPEPLVYFDQSQKHKKK